LSSSQTFGRIVLVNRSPTFGPLNNVSTDPTFGFGAATTFIGLLGDL